MLTAAGMAGFLGRYPVFGPALREWTRCPRPLLLVTAVRPHDWADWDTPNVRARLLVYRVTGGDRLFPAGVREVDSDGDFDAVLNHIDDPIRRAVAGGPGAFALDWTGQGARPRESDVESDWPADDVRVRLAHPPGQAPAAAFYRNDGRAEPCPLEPATAPPATLPVSATPAERQAVLAWIAGQRVYCRACGGHPPGQVRCAGAGNLFPSLAPEMAYRAETVAAAVTFYPLPSGRALAADGRILTVTADGIAAHSFADGEWRLDAGAVGSLPDLADGGFLLRG